MTECNFAFLLRLDHQLAALSVTDAVRDLDFSTNGQMLLAACNDGHVYVYRLGFRHTAPTLLLQYSAHHARVVCARFSPTGHTAASGDGNGKLHLWRAVEGKWHGMVSWYQPKG